MSDVLQQHPQRIPPRCPICEAPMVIMPTVQFHYAAGFDEFVYDCEKCRTISTIMIDQGHVSWTTPSRSR